MCCAASQLSAFIGATYFDWTVLSYPPTPWLLLLPNFSLFSKILLSSHLLWSLTSLYILLLLHISIFVVLICFKWVFLWLDWILWAGLCNCSFKSLLGLFSFKFRKIPTIIPLNIFLFPPFAETLAKPMLGYLKPPNAHWYCVLFIYLIPFSFCVSFCIVSVAMSWSYFFLVQHLIFN